MDAINEGARGSAWRDRLLVLDVDGVVVHSHPDGQGEWHDGLLSDLGIDPIRLHSDFFRPVWSDVVRGKRGLRESLRPVLHEINPDVAVDALLSYWFRKHSLVDESVIDVAVRWTKLTGLRPWLASNQEALRAQYLWNELNLSSHFEELVYSAALGVAKDSEDFFHLASARMRRFGKSQIIYFDDELANIDVARRAGWSAHLYRGVNDLNAILP